jgi:putative Mg2+ transporter-C (MgtC) family protein
MNEILSTEHIDILMKFGFSILCGMVMGIGAHKSGRPAGISTRSMVSGAAMMFTYLSVLYGSPNDKTRIAAQIVSGVGFLGGSIILRREDGQRVQNLTTAAGLWMAAAVGMAIGFGEYYFAVIGALYSLLITNLHKSSPNDK